jgi:SulP family sulfate permease
LRFGALVNFVSHSVVLGFTLGAAVVIAVGQLPNLLGLDCRARPRRWPV